MNYMKRNLKKIVLMAAAFLMVNVAFAQFGQQWGATEEEQQENVLKFNFLKNAYNNAEYQEAVKLFWELTQSAPKGHSSIYTNGINTYKKLAEAADAPELKEKYIDSIMIVYDLRIENMGDDHRNGKPYITRMKAEDYMAYRPNDVEGIKKVFNEAFEANGDHTPADFVNIYFNFVTNLYKTDKIERDEYLAEYDRLEPYVNSHFNERHEDDKKTFSALLVSSGAADCEAIEQLYKERIENNPNDTALIKSVANMLARGQCNNEFASKVMTRRFELEPNANTALSLAGYYLNMEDYNGALKYLRFAYEHDDIESPRDQVLLMLAGAELQAKNFRAAADLARRGIENNNTGGGSMYIVLAQATVDGAACTGFDKQTAYWLGSDILARGLRDERTNHSQHDRINRMLSSYRANFPSKEECFFRGLTEGSSYTVKCGWVAGTTTVRTHR